MMASLPLALLKSRGSGALVRLGVRLLRALNIKASFSTLLFGLLGLAGLFLLAAAWLRNRKDGGARLWPLTLPALSVCGIVLLALLKATPPSVDLSSTESGQGVLEMARATPLPPDPLNDIRGLVASGLIDRVNYAFVLAAERGEAARPVFDLLMEVLATDGNNAETRLQALLKVVPPDQAESVLRTLSLQGIPVSRAEALCFLAARGAPGSLEALSAVLSRTDLSPEDEPALRRVVSCVASLPLHAQVAFLPQLRAFIERMCRPPHDAGDAWSGMGARGHGDPLASMAVWRETMTALWTIAPSEPTKAFAWDLLENAPFETRNKRRVVINQVTTRMPTRALP